MEPAEAKGLPLDMTGTIYCKVPRRIPALFCTEQYCDCNTPRKICTTPSGSIHVRMLANKNDEMMFNAAQRCTAERILQWIRDTAFYNIVYNLRTRALWLRS